MSMISILGDSISTFEGMNPQGYAVFYEGEKREINELETEEETWWGRVLNVLGADLCVNASYSGSRMSGLIFPAGCSDERLLALRTEACVPDIILVFMGYNDFAYGVPVACKSDECLTDRKMTFSGAYELVLSHLKILYPHSRIVCGTLMRSRVRGRIGWQFPEIIDAEPFERYNEAIRTACRKCGVELADLSAYDMAYETLDGSHPTALGHKTIADLWIKEMKKG